MGARAIAWREGRIGMVDIVAAVDAVVLVLAVVAATTVDAVVAAALPSAPHWRTGERALVLVDQTGDPEWEQATRYAVTVWNRSGGDVRVTWARGDGPCRGDGRRVPVCLTRHRTLERVGPPGLEGLTRPAPGSAGHYVGAVVRVCSDCGLDPARRRVVLTHELGHVLGLGHSRQPTSVMHPVGGAELPSAADYAALRLAYAHDDG